MSSFFPYLLNWLLDFGYPALWLTVFIAAAGLPLPTNLLLLAAGAFAELGEFNLFFLLGITVTASVCGDNLGYWIGRRWGSKVLDWLEQSKWQRLISSTTIKKSRTYFNKHGGWAIFLSRFLISALGGVINLLAGSDPYSYRRFLVFDIGGEFLGAALPLALGYLFGESWEAIGDLLGSLSGFILGLFLVILLSLQLAKILLSTKKEKHIQEELPPEGKKKTRPLDSEQIVQSSGPLLL